jgi:type I restriction-modification system DNA methylase subunit
MTTKKTGLKTPKSCAECSHWKEVKRQIRVSEFLNKVITNIEGKLKSSQMKPTIGDYLKLLQMEQDIEHEVPKEIRVTWVEPTGPSNSEK